MTRKSKTHAGLPRRPRGRPPGPRPLTDAQRDERDHALIDSALLVRAVRAELGLTQEALAEALRAAGLPATRQLVSAWERGPYAGDAACRPSPAAREEIQRLRRARTGRNQAES